MEKGKVTLGVSPLRWCTMRGWLGEEAMLLFKGCCYVRAWDPDTKTWSYPENFDPLVRSALGLPATAAPDIRLEPKRFSGELRAKIDYMQRSGDAGAVFNSSPMEPHWLDSDPYKVLMISEDAPQGLVEWARIWWAQELKRVGGSDEPARRCEEAYAEIVRGRLAADEFDRQVKRESEEGVS